MLQNGINHVHIVESAGPCEGGRFQAWLVRDEDLFHSGECEYCVVGEHADQPHGSWSDTREGAVMGLCQVLRIHAEMPHVRAIEARYVIGAPVVYKATCPHCGLTWYTIRDPLGQKPVKCCKPFIVVFPKDESDVQ